MHELSLAMSIVDTATSEVRRHSGKEVESIVLEIGVLAGVEMDSFNFAWPMAVKDSVLKNAELTVHRIPGKAVCQDCGCAFEKKQLFDACPKCQSYFTSITQGKELKIKSLTIIENKNRASFQ